MMRIFKAIVMLLVTGVCTTATRVVSETVSVEAHTGDGSVTAQENRDGWVNPEDLAPMPQCIAQQAQSAWLQAMTQCTAKRCVRHFLFICTHHQWLTELSCLSVSFTPNVVRRYLPYCSRSVLAETQLYNWIHKITGRTWLANVGDAVGLQNPSPASLVKGYASVDVVNKAPTCLATSVSARSTEPFQHILGSCTFTGTIQHAGNAARPWEYSERLHSMISLDFETVSYSLAHPSLYVYLYMQEGQYFDKACLCNTFNLDADQDPCLEPGELEWTIERLWLNATCGPASIPSNSLDQLKTTEFAYISTEDWHWPQCVSDMPQNVTQLTHQCATDACATDASGYCIITRAVDRACFCRDITYDSCGGSCHIFETRIEYVNWLHDLCGSVQDWKGLPTNWHHLATPTTRELMPWRWTIASKHSFEFSETTNKCPWSNTEMLLGIFLINLIQLFATSIYWSATVHRIARGLLGELEAWRWFPVGIASALIQVLGFAFSAFLVQNAPGYESIPVFQLTLLWCSMPRISLRVLQIGLRPFEAKAFPAAASSLCAETLLQILSAFPMILTVGYGLQHNMYLRDLTGVEGAESARIMYLGALAWLIVIFALSLRAHHLATKMDGGSCYIPERQQRPFDYAESAAFSHWSIPQGSPPPYSATPPYSDTNRCQERVPILPEAPHTPILSYGAFPTAHRNECESATSPFQSPIRALRMSVFMCAVVLWIVQWLFWAGFIGLSSNDYCPPFLGVLMIVWAIASLASGAVVGVLEDPGKYKGTG